MPTTLPTLLLIQIRDHPGSERHEQECVSLRLGRPIDSFTSVNIVQHPDLRWEDVEKYDVVILGGAGAHSALADDPFTEGLLDITRRLVDAGRPFFGSCYGHQFLARALGGELYRDPENGEIGTFDITLNEAGLADPLFEGAERVFPVHLGHHDFVTRAPEGTTVLGASERCSIQVLRVDGLPIYGTQFHGEMDESDMRERLRVYGDVYFEGDEGRQRFLASLRDTPLVSGLLRRFFDLYV